MDQTPLGFLKCNVDVALFYYDNWIDFWTFLQDHTRGFLFAKTDCIQPVLSSHEAETLALLNSIAWGRLLVCKMSSMNQIANW